MRRDYKVLKFKLMRGCGKEIWGDKLMRHSRFLRLRKKDPRVLSRKVVNFVILEFERRVIFDYSGRYSSFGKDRKLIFPGFFKYIRDRGYFLFTRIIKAYTSHFFSSMQPRYFGFTGVKARSGVRRFFNRAKSLEVHALQTYPRQNSLLEKGLLRARIRKPEFAGTAP